MSQKDKTKGHWVTTAEGRKLFINGGTGDQQPGGNSGVKREKRQHEGDRKQLSMLRSLANEKHTKRDRKVIERKMESISKRLLG